MFIIRRFIRIIIPILICIVIIQFLALNVNKQTRNYSFFKSVNPDEPKILCLIMTAQENIETKAKAIHEAWAQYCDKHFFVTVVNPNETNSSIEVQINDVPVLQPMYLKEDTYTNLTDKVFRSIIHIYNNYDYYDWYLKADDDTFIFVDNLRKFVKTKNPMAPVTYGCHYNIIVDGGFLSGGAGYVLSKEALNRIGSHLTSNYTFCKNTGAEDTDMATCLHEIDVHPDSSIDEEGQERFHPLASETYYHEPIPEWLPQILRHPFEKGKKSCSESTISFHYESEDSIKKLAFIANLNHHLNGKVNLTTLLINFA